MSRYAEAPTYDADYWLRRERRRQWRHAHGHRGFRPAELIAMILGFIVFWPIGLAILFWKIAGRPRLPILTRVLPDGAFEPPADTSRERGDGHRPSGNSAFEAYRRAELERLEAERRKLAAEEQAFADFLAELKQARDREEFDRFIEERRAGRLHHRPPNGDISGHAPEPWSG